MTGFTPTGYKIGDQRFEQGLLISPEQAVGWTGAQLGQLNLAEILASLNLFPKPEFLLLGSGPSMLQPPAAFRREVEAAGMGLEVMDSRAAARTWGVLRAEERWIVGALLPLA
ncbi:MAG: hypothetical protein KBT59_12515 [Sphingomonadales bacterium]|nr:hypothetical protein [Sphingomonadales bacterium]